MAAGDIASVKGAIDRLKTPQSLPAAVTRQGEPVEQFAGRLGHHDGAAGQPGAAGAVKAGAPNPMLNVAQNVQAAAGGVKFGAQVVFSGEAQCDTAQNATTLGDVVKLLINLGADAGGSGPHGGGADQIGECDHQRQRGEGLGQLAAGRFPADAAAPQEDGDGASQAVSQAWPAGGRRAEVAVEGAAFAVLAFDQRKVQFRLCFLKVPNGLFGTFY